MGTKYGIITTLFLVHFLSNPPDSGGEQILNPALADAAIISFGSTIHSKERLMQTFYLAILSIVLTFATASGAFAKDVQVKGYTKKDGTTVKGYTKHVKDPDTVQVKGYTKKDGTVVKGYTRKKPGTAAAAK